MKGPCFLLQGWHAGVIYVCFLFVSTFLVVRDVFSSRIFQHHNILETCDNFWVYHLVLLHPFASTFRHQLQTLLLYFIALLAGPVGRAPYFAYLVVVSCGDGVGILPKRTRRLGPGARPKLESLSSWFLKVSLELVALSRRQSVSFQILKHLCGSQGTHVDTIMRSSLQRQDSLQDRSTKKDVQTFAGLGAITTSARFAEERSRTSETPDGPHFRMFASIGLFGNFRFHHALGVLKLHLHYECSTWTSIFMKLCPCRFLGSDELSKMLHLAGQPVDWDDPLAAGWRARAVPIPRWQMKLADLLPLLAHLSFEHLLNSCILPFYHGLNRWHEVTSEVKRVLLRLGGSKAGWLTQSNAHSLSTEYCNIAKMTCHSRSPAFSLSKVTRSEKQRRGSKRDARSSQRSSAWNACNACNIDVYELWQLLTDVLSNHADFRSESMMPGNPGTRHLKKHRASMRFWCGVSRRRGRTSYSIRSGTLRCLVSWWYNCYIIAICNIY